MPTLAILCCGSPVACWPEEALVPEMVVPEYCMLYCCAVAYQCLVDLRKLWHQDGKVACQAWPGTQA